MPRLFTHRDPRLDISYITDRLDVPLIATKDAGTNRDEKEATVKKIKDLMATQCYLTILQMESRYRAILQNSEKEAWLGKQISKAEERFYHYVEKMIEQGTYVVADKVSAAYLRLRPSNTDFHILYRRANLLLSIQNALKAGKFDKVLELCEKYNQKFAACEAVKKAMHTVDYYLGVLSQAKKAKEYGKEALALNLLLPLSSYYPQYQPAVELKQELVHNLTAKSRLVRQKKEELAVGEGDYGYKKFQICILQGLHAYQVGDFDEAIIWAEKILSKKVYPSDEARGNISDFILDLKKIVADLNSIKAKRDTAQIESSNALLEALLVKHSAQIIDLPQDNIVIDLTED